MKWLASNHKNIQWKSLEPKPGNFWAYVLSLLPYLQSNVKFLQKALFILFMCDFCLANIYSAIRMVLKDYRSLNTTHWKKYGRTLGELASLKRRKAEHFNMFSHAIKNKK